MMKNHERTWEYFGEKDPYFGVYSVAEMRSEELDDKSLEKFFASGEEYLSRIWRDIEENFIPAFLPRRSLDFGCGVGRITLPVAKRSGEAVGVDISSGMLGVAEQNAARFHVSNSSFLKADDGLSKVTGKFDFVHSFIVLQHINPKKGIPIFKKLVDLLEEGGIGVLHVQYGDSALTSAEKLRYRMYRDFPLVHAARNLLLRKRREPLMPMYNYDLNELMLILQQNECHKCLARFSGHGVDGVLLIFQKEKAELY